MKASTSTVLTVLLLAACESDDPAAPSPDAGVTPVADSGADRGAVSDDAGTDAPADSGPTRGPVTISVRDLSGPVASVQIVIQEAGQPLVLATTAANGEVMRDVGKGAVVYAIFPSLHRIETVTGVEPGDRIELRVPANKPPSMELSVDLTAVPSDATTFGYFMQTGGTSFATPPGTNAVTLAPATDADGSTVDLLFAAVDGANHPVIWATKTGLAVSASGSVTVAANDWSSFQPVSHFLTTGGSLAGALATYKSIVPIRGGRPFYLFTSATAGSGAAPPLDFVRPPTTFTPLVRHRVSNTGGVFPANWSSERLVQEPIATGDFTQDLGALLPAITAASAGGTFVAPTVAYTAGGTLPATSIVDVTLEATIDGGEPLRWYVRTMPGAGASVTLPSLPDAVAAAADAGATPWTLRGLAFVESPQLDAKTARSVPIAVGNETTLVPPKTGSAVIRTTAFGGSSLD